MFADKLKVLRGNKKITQEQFAKDINVTKGAVAMWETGRRTPDLEMTKKIALYFNVSIDELVGNEINKFSNQLDDVYFSIAKQAQEDGIAPEDIEMAISMIKHLKFKGKDKEGG